MSAATSDPPPGDGWTTSDLEALPDDGIRRELLDGVQLVVEPWPTKLPISRLTPRYL